MKQVFFFLLFLLNKSINVIILCNFLKKKRIIFERKKQNSIEKNIFLVIKLWHLCKIKRIKAFIFILYIRSNLKSKRNNVTKNIFDYRSIIKSNRLGHLTSNLSKDDSEITRSIVWWISLDEVLEKKNYYYSKSDKNTVSSGSNHFEIERSFTVGEDLWDWLKTKGRPHDASYSSLSSFILLSTDMS